jgi:hypothetical protein
MVKLLVYGLSKEVILEYFALQMQYKNCFIMRYTVLFLLAVTINTSCADAQQKTAETKRITVGPGPEDMVTDNEGAFSRLLISCCARREGEPSFGEIVSYTPATAEVDTLVRIGMPDSLYFQPHGIFLDKAGQPQKLYVISHEHDEGFHPVYIWAVHGDTLVFEELITSALLHSPNALTLGSNGELFIVNDSGKRGSMVEKILKLKRANIVRLARDAGGEWQGSVVADKLGYPAGINRIDDKLYAGDAVYHRLHVYRISSGQLIPLEPIKGLRGNDNIRAIEKKLYLTGHVKPFRFISHVKSSEKTSPVEVWEVDPVTREITSLFYTDGSLISAGSTAVVLGGKLYISQIFDPFILEVPLDQH